MPGVSGQGVEMTPRPITKTQQLALAYCSLDYAESDEPGAGLFAYTTEATPASYPGTSCECVEDAAECVQGRIQSRGQGSISGRVWRAARSGVGDSMTLQGLILIICIVAFVAAVAWLAEWGE